MGAFLSPPAVQAGDMHVGCEQFLKSSVTVSGDRTHQRPLNEEHGAAPGKESGDLPALNAANFHLIRADGKNRRASRLAKLASVVRFPAEDGPTDTGVGGGCGDLRKRGGPDGLNKDTAWPKGGFGLDGPKYLGALSDWIVVGVNDVSLDAEFRSCGFRGCRLFHLIVVVLGD